MTKKTREELIDPVRIWTRLPRIKHRKMQEMADALGLTLSQFVGMCAWAGVQHIMPHLEPGALSSAEWEVIYQENQEQWQLHFEEIEHEVRGAQREETTEA